MFRRISVGVGLFALVSTLGAQDPASYKREFLNEFDHSSKQVVELAKAIPAEKYSWRPGPGVRSVSEVFMHITSGHYILLDFAGQAPPADLYGKVEGAGQPRAMALIKRSAELEKTTTEKDKVIALLQQSIDAVHTAFEKANTADLEKAAKFFGRDTTARGIYLRILAHVNEHMGQSIAYARVNGIVPPWSKPAAGKE